MRIKQFVIAQQPQQDVFRDQLCPPNKQYNLMYANKKIDLQFWHTLKLDDSKDKFKFFIDTKEFKFSVDDFSRVFQLPQAINNNNVVFVDAPTFIDMLPFFRNELGFSLPMCLPTHFETKGLL
ncbi:hypothetical protein Tco_1469409 [Tanacetum coccineum]